MKQVKLGRPTDCPKTIVKRARMTPEDVKKLDECCAALGEDISTVLRMGVYEIYNKIKK